MSGSYTTAVALCGVILLGLPNLAQAANVQPPTTPYAVAHGAPLKPAESPVRDADGFRQLRVEFNGIQGDRVPAFLYLPKQGPAKHPAVLLQYGSGGTKKTDYIVRIGELFVRHGFVVLTIDAPERGERAPKVKRQRSWLDFDHAQKLFVQYLGDDSRAVDYLLTRPEVDPRRLGFVGISWGAITGITFVAHDPRVKAMASLVGGGDLLARVPLRLTKEAQETVRHLDPVNHVALIAPRPLLLINVTKDRLISRASAEALHKAAGKRAKVEWIDTDHNFRGQDRTKIALSVIRFLDEGMPGKGKAQRP
jgi:dienelactone hydrolase